MSTLATEQAATTTGSRYHRLRYGSTRGRCGVALGFVIDTKPIDQVPDADRCRRCWSTPMGARLERSSMAQRQGIRATADGGVCPRCDMPVLKEDRIVKRGEVWIHAACHNQEHE